MSRQIWSFALRAILCLVFVSSLLAAQEPQMSASNRLSQETLLNIEKAVRKQIVGSPRYGVFDEIHFAIKGDSTVILRGKASRPILKSELENSVKRIEGVKAVQNEIHVLPVSGNDDRIRAAVYARIYGRNSTLSRYTSNRGGGKWLSPSRLAAGITNDPPLGWHAIHIIVENGNVTLTGVVDTSGDFAMAGMLANSTPGVFSVDNALAVASKES